MKSMYQRLVDAGAHVTTWGGDAFAPVSLAVRTVIAENAPAGIEHFEHDGRLWVCIPNALEAGDGIH